jgi:predicted DNA binding CopG/RHH family protein
MKSSKKASKKRVNQVNPLAGDLSELLQSDSWQRVRFELQPKNKTITIRMSEELLEAVKEQAEKSGLDYQKFIRLTLEKVVAKAG